MNKERLVTAVVTLVIAAATGHLMQNGDAIAARFNGETPAENLTNTQKAGLESVELGVSVPALPTDRLTPALTGAPQQAFFFRVASFDHEFEMPRQVEVGTPRPLR